MARIVFTLEDGTEIETELDSDVITVGRHPDSIVVLPSGSVSSHHATIKRRAGSYYVQDLGTTNGTKLNGVEVEEAKLEDGDKITFGDIHGVVHLTDAPVSAKPMLPLPEAPALAVAPSLPRRAVSARGRTAPAVVYKESTGCAGFFIFLLLLIIALIIGL
ncbi:MAG: FHA domain-containing protein, partial [Roseimicrobium sp.]